MSGWASGQTDIVETIPIHISNGFWTVEWRAGDEHQDRLSDTANGIRWTWALPIPAPTQEKDG